MNYKTVLTELRQAKQDAEARIRDVEIAIRAVQKLAGQEQDGMKSAELPASLAMKIMALMNENPSHLFSFRDISEALGGNEKTLRGALARMLKAGKIETAGRGQYRFKMQLMDSAESPKVNAAISKLLD